MASAPQDRKSASKIVDLLAAGPHAQLRVLPAQERRGRAPTREDHPRAGAAAAVVRVRDLRRRGLDPRPHPRHRDAGEPGARRSRPWPTSPARATPVTRSSALLDEYEAGGVRNILALAGDPPADGSDPGGDFTYATRAGGAGAEPSRRLLGRRGRPPRAAPPLGGRPGPGPPQPGHQAGGRRLRDHAVLLRVRRLPAHDRRAGGARVHHPGPAGRDAAGGRTARAGWCAWPR